MLVLTRKLGESITIDDHIKIVVVQIKGKQVRLGIKAPKETKIHRRKSIRPFSVKIPWRVRPILTMLASFPRNFIRNKFFLAYLTYQLITLLRNLVLFLGMGGF